MTNEIKTAQTQFSTLDHVPVGAFVLQSDFTVLFWNSTLEDWAGISRDEVVGGNIDEFFPHLREPKYASRLLNIFEGGPPTIFSSQLHQFIIPVTLPNEQAQIQHGTVTAVANPNGSDFYALFVIQDVTDLTNRIHDYRAMRDQALQAEAKLQTYAADLERSNQELQNFAYIASHDLQEPLRKIQLFSNRLKTRQADFDEQSLDYLERMFNASTRMQALIQDLLEYSRLTTHGQPFVSVHLNEIISDVLSDLEIRIQESHAQIVVGQLPAIEADPVQMQQLFLNLIGNALKYYRPEESPKIKVNAEIQENLCRLTIADNGIGFDEKYSERIFRVFERLHGQGKYEGTGIGLAICRKIINRHNGEITVTSKPGKGSTFIVTLPITHTREI
jgi:PAS domain S-box-containing protein